MDRRTEVTRTGTLRLSELASLFGAISPPPGQTALAKTGAALAKAEAPRSVDGLDMDAVQWCIAEAVGEPIAGFSVRARCGRFVLADFYPLHAPDPEILVCVGFGASVFNAAMTKFSKARRVGIGGRGSLFPPAQWFRKVKTAMGPVLEALAEVDADLEEWSFVTRWMANVASRGKRI